MKANELMVGDWVLMRGTPVQVRAIGVNTIRFSDMLITEPLENIEPIPITPEILEKNFGKPYPRGGFHNYRMEKDETIAFVIEDRRVSAAPDNRVVFCRVPGTYICDVNYVHELQHALRLCGIDKEIIL